MSGNICDEWKDAITGICLSCLGDKPRKLERSSVGHGNYVFIAECMSDKYVIRCSEKENAYKNTIRWLEKLDAIDIPVPKVVGKGTYKAYDFLVLTYIEGEDIGLVYPQLTDKDKRAIAKEIVQIQNRVASLELDDVSPEWSWYECINEMLMRARERIVQNGYFQVEKVDNLQKQAAQLKAYFSEIKPIAYLDDISSKNLLINNGRISGIIDVDWMGMGDRLTYVALTNMALLNMELDTDYVKYILEEMRVSEMQKKAFLFYTQMYCVDFMGERGMNFMDKTVEVNEQIIDRLNGIYYSLMADWSGEKL